MKRLLTLAAVLAFVAGAAFAQVFPPSTCYLSDGGKRLTCQSGSTVVFDGTVSLTTSATYTFGAAEYVAFDGATTAHTDTHGVVDLDFAGITAATSGLNLALTQNNGTAAGANMYAVLVTLTGNDADGDVDGILVNAAATANAAAGTYEYGFAFDCAENTAGACLDGVLIESSGANTGLTDGIDVSAANIANAINIGSNPILGGNAETFFVGSADNTFTFTTSASGGPVLLGADDAGAANTTYDTTGAGAIDVGSADVTDVQIVTDGGTFDVGTVANAVSLTAAAGQTATFVGADDAGAANTALDTTGAGAIDVGSADVTDVQVITDGGTLDVGSVANVMSLTVAAGQAATFIGADDAGAADTTIDTTGAGAIDVGSADVTDVAIITDGGTFDVGTTANAVTLTVAAGQPAVFLGADDAGAADTTLDTTGAGAIVIGSADVTAVTITTDGTGDGSDLVLPAGAVQSAEILDDTIDGADLADLLTLDATLLGIANGGTGGVILNWHDYADSADDDMAHVVMTANCTDATTGAEDCDFSIGVVEGGVAAETRIVIDADAGIVIGSNNSTAFEVMSDSTGDAEVVLPAQSISGTEMSNDTVDGGQLADSITLDANLHVITGANDVVVSTAAVAEAGTESAEGTIATQTRCFGGFCQATLTLTAYSLAITDPGAAAGYGGVTLYTFPEGYINELGLVADLALTAGAGGIADDFDGDIAFGSTIDAGAGLAATEVDWVAAVATPQAVAGVTTGDATFAIGEQIIHDGHSAAQAVVLNLNIDDADIAAGDTVSFTGTVVITWAALGDN